MPIPGIFASQISGHLFAPSGAYDSIATTTVGSGGASGVTFSSIPSTYTHLQIRSVSNQNTGASATMTFNGNTGANYSWRFAYGQGSSTASSGAGSANNTYFNSTTTTGIFCANIMDILDYTNTNKNKTVKILNGWDGNGSGEVILWSGAFYNTSAINSITLLPAGTLWSQYSSFALYGIKGA